MLWHAHTTDLLLPSHLVLYQPLAVQSRQAQLQRGTAALHHSPLHAIIRAHRRQHALQQRAQPGVQQRKGLQRGGRHTRLLIASSCR